MGVRNILLDTNAYVAFKQGNPGALEILQYTDFIGLSTIVLGELLSGFAVDNREEKNRQEMQLFIESSRVKILSVDETTTEHYARIYQMLRGKGQPIPTNDMWIAATAMQHKLAVFSYDRYFQAVDSLIIDSNLGDLLY